MKMNKQKLYKLFANCFLSIAILTVARSTVHCIIILHQPDVPKKLRERADSLE